MRIIALVLVAAMATYGAARPEIREAEAKLLSNEATEMLHSGSPLEAFDKYQEALKIDSDSTIIRFNLSQVYFNYWPLLMEKLNVSKQELADQGIAMALSARESGNKEFLENYEAAKSELDAVALYEAREILFVLHNNYAASIWFSFEVLDVKVNFEEARLAYEECLKFADRSQTVFIKLMIMRTYIAEAETDGKIEYYKTALEILEEVKEAVHPGFYKMVKDAIEKK